VEHSDKIKRLEHPPVEICIVKSDDDVIIRFRDQGGGIGLEHQHRVWEYSFTTVQKQEEDFLSSRIHMQHSTGGPIAGVSLIHVAGLWTSHVSGLCQILWWFT
jgi:hypothetical protein